MSRYARLAAESGVRVVEVPAAPDASPGEQRRIRGKCAVDVFVRIFEHIRALLPPDEWGAFYGRLNAARPDLHARIDAAERHADDLAARYIEGGVDEFIAFCESVVDYEAAHREAVAGLAAAELAA